MLNTVVLMGRIAHTPEVKKGKEGKEFTVTSLAVPNGLDEKGNEKAMFVDIVCYGENQKAFDYVDTGDQVAISGRLDLYTFIKRDNTTGYGTRIIVNNIEFGAKKAAPADVAPADYEVAKEEPKQENSRRARK